jgi:hypothetical protein
MLFDVFSKNPGNTSAEISERQQGKKSMKISFLTCCHGGLADTFTIDIAL